jgi:hypothetical protein
MYNDTEMCVQHAYHIYKINFLDTETSCLMAMKDACISTEKLLNCLKNLEDWFSKEGTFSLLPHPHENYPASDQLCTG